MNKIILIIGAPGSGKTTAASKLQGVDVVHYSLGGMYREIAEQETELGERVKPLVDKGAMIPIPIAREVISEMMQGNPGTIIIDGFPRDMEQALMMDELLGSDYHLEKVVELIVNGETARKRIADRARGEDDKSKKFNGRIARFAKEILQIREHYQKQTLYISIDANQELEAVVNDLKAGLKME